MKHDIRAALTGVACLFVVLPIPSKAQHPQDPAATRGGLRDPAKKETAMELVSAAENSSLDWKAQYGYIYYDAIVMHGPGNGRYSFGGIRASAMKRAKPPSHSGDETAFLDAFLDARRVAMKSENGHQDTSRVDTMQRKFVRERNLRLEPPLKFQVYGDKYEIPRRGE